MRTTWRDLTEHHCPRFGRHRTVALPVFAPKGVEGEVTDYRIQLSFDGEPPTGGVQPAPAGSCLARTWWRAKRLQPTLLQPDSPQKNLFPRPRPWQPGDRVVTPWIPVIGARVMGLPLVRVELRSVGGEVKGARVEVRGRKAGSLAASCCRLAASLHLGSRPWQVYAATPVALSACVQHTHPAPPPWMAAGAVRP